MDDFLSMKDDELKLCKDNILKLNLDSNTVINYGLISLFVIISTFQHC